MNDKINLTEKLSTLTQHWAPQTADRADRRFQQRRSGDSLAPEIGVGRTRARSFYIASAPEL
jgi:hypothetical protein